MGFYKLSNREPLAPEQVIGQGTSAFSVGFCETVVCIRNIPDDTVGEKPGKIFHDGQDMVDVAGLIMCR